MTQRTKLNQSRILARVKFKELRYNQHYGFVRRLENDEALILNLTKASAASEMIDCASCGVSPAVRGESCGYCFSKNKSNENILPPAPVAKSELSILNFVARSRRNISCRFEQEIAERNNGAIPMSEILQGRALFFGAVLAAIFAAFIIGQFIGF
ncbi:MAG TPA: hypothetical protein VF648_21330 [Pyrinomonadaceae bacterium]|jgi:hypothetical protein